jgi:hypothetical protein
MEREVKFKQIAGVGEEIYALDEDGGLWVKSRLSRPVADAWVKVQAPTVICRLNFEAKAE